MTDSKGKIEQPATAAVVVVALIVDLLLAYRNSLFSLVLLRETVVDPNPHHPFDRSIDQSGLPSSSADFLGTQ